MPDIFDALAELPGSAQNLPDVVRPPVWVPERIVTFEGARPEGAPREVPGRMLIVRVPGHLRSLTTDALPPGVEKRVEATFLAGVASETVIDKWGVK